ncbi:DUF7134 domain-containing protein [Nonomuraea ceibae]|uniref:DUF7134 domain-containing protein n=1 Tax=Nonomuraea ceibae TaxID=1935170 RepID=UPI001C5E5D31|nr:hypothetical protein [Nonomuraea ceibae]
MIAAVTTAATLGPLLVSGPKAWWIVALGVVASAPVYWRRRAPMTVALLVGAAMSVMVFWEKPFLPFGPLVAVHTIADRSPAWQRLAAIPAIVTAVGVSLALPGRVRARHQRAGEPVAYRGTGLRCALALSLERSWRNARNHPLPGASARERDRLPPEADSATSTG